MSETIIIRGETIERVPHETKLIALPNNEKEMSHLVFSLAVQHLSNNQRDALFHSLWNRSPNKDAMMKILMAGTKEPGEKHTNVQKVAEALGVDAGRASDKSASWVVVENDEHSICISFTGDGEEFDSISVCEKVYQVVEEKVVVKVRGK